MASIHMRVSDAMHARIQEEAAAQNSSVARFCREAAVARTVLWAQRRGLAWADADSWKEVIACIKAIDEHDTKLRAAVARKAREMRDA